MRARVGLILRIGWILNEIPAGVTGSYPGSADSGGGFKLIVWGVIEEKTGVFSI